MGNPLPQPEQYGHIIRALQYLTLTLPDIAFAVNKLAQFMQHPTESHWQSMKRVLRYLRGTHQLGLFISTNSVIQLQGFSDSY
jgi:hypothetical protein